MLQPLPGDIFSVGQVLNNTYEIEAILGRGGTGEVYRARNQISGRVVAVKVLSGQFTGNADYLELMKREEEMRAIMHDAVVRYSDNSRTDDGHVFLVMDYVDGPSLDGMMMRGRVDARDLLIIAHRVAEGLVATHARGIVHRDLSPDNIILRGGNPAEAVIIDFGIAKDTAADARTIVGNDFAGKYEYAAPEQLEGRAEARSDLYSLGALLLAAYRGDVPFRGSTPGEMVRRKQRPLDTEGVEEPLKGVIDWLAAPDIPDRPAHAEAVVERLTELLRLNQKVAPKDRKTKPKKTRSRGLGWLAVASVLAVAGGGIWYSDIWRGLIETPPPVADPYRLSATVQGGITGNAPSEAAAAQIVGAYASVSGQEVAAGLLDLAQGVPSETWAAGAAEILQRMRGLEDWTVEIIDNRVRLTGLAPDKPARDTYRDTFQQVAGAQGFDMSADILAGPKDLPGSAVQTVLDSSGTCGPLALAGGSDTVFSLGDTIAVTGHIAEEADAARLTEVLDHVVGDRTVRVDAVVLNNDVCRVRAVLPDRDNGNLNIWLGNGSDGSANLAGIFRTGENPLAEVQIPASVTDGWLWVMVVDNTNKVFHLLPNINQTSHAVTDVGEVEGGVRRIRILHSVEQYLQNDKLPAMQVTEDSYGKSEVVAILSDQPLFDLRRPTEESIASATDALAEALSRDDLGVRAIARRLIDARP